MDGMFKLANIVLKVVIISPYNKRTLILAHNVIIHYQARPIQNKMG
jgi:hypothetical protein